MPNVIKMKNLSTDQGSIHRERVKKTLNNEVLAQGPIRREVYQKEEGEANKNTSQTPNERLCPSKVNCCCSSASTPPAITDKPRLFAIAITAATIASLSEFDVMPPHKRLVDTTWDW